VIGGAAVAVPCAALSLAGYGAAGIVGGSWAAAKMSAIGNVAAGSLYATMQSAGATGLFVKGMYAGGAATAAGVTTKVIEARKVLWNMGGNWATATQSAIGHVAAGSLSVTMRTAGATGQFIKGMYTGAGATVAVGASTRVVKDRNAIGDVWRWMTGKKP
jgi:hypothetical protein